jgi:hypothetical protein
VPGGGQAGEATPAGQAPFLGAGHLDAQQPGQEGAVAELLPAGVLELGGEGLGGGGQTQVGEVPAQLLVHALLAHRAASTSSA